ncbi:MAG: hypothetical protein HW421_3174 [Ignavibacteria bacterium]|nr:hypothetical protein [Ignavibacteria bacterium]
MIRKLMIPNKQNIDISIPANYINKKIEILIIPYMEEYSEDIKFWSSDELEDMSFQQNSSVAEDSEDYSKW